MRGLYIGLYMRGCILEVNPKRTWVIINTVYHFVEMFLGKEEAEQGCVDFEIGN